MSQQPHQTRLNTLAALASVSVASILVLAKLWAFAVTGSLAVAATLADSGLDLMVSLFALLAIRYAALPPDDDHAFGHSSAEDLASLGQSVVILVSGGVIAGAAVSRLLSGGTEALASESAGIAVMCLAIVLTLALVAFQRGVAKRTGNKVVAADSLHYVGDLVPNIGAILSLLAAHYLGLTAVDSVVALVAAGIMAFGALRIGKRAVDALMDRQAPDRTIGGIAEIVRDHPGVRGFHDLKTRMAGSQVFVTLHIELDGSQSLHDAHEIGASLRQAIIAAYPHADVTIHKDVWYPE